MNKLYPLDRAIPQGLKPIDFTALMARDPAQRAPRYPAVPLQDNDLIRGSLGSYPAQVKMEERVLAGISGPVEAKPTSRR